MEGLRFNLEGLRFNSNLEGLTITWKVQDRLTNRATYNNYGTVVDTIDGDFLPTSASL